MEHKSVLLTESIQNLVMNKDGIYVDCTMGGGGHSLEILKKLGPKGMLIGIDQDSYALERSRQRLNEYKNVRYVQDNFKNLDAILQEEGISQVDGILLDLGVSSFQFDDTERGFSYWDEADLDMRMNRDQPLTAKIVVNTYSLVELARIFQVYGEEQKGYRLAKRIVKERETKEICTTKELVEIIKSALSEKEKRKSGHPGRKIFQALRIEVNKELEVLEKVLPVIEKRLKLGGRMAIITFHSIEDRIVKEFIKSKENPCQCPKDFPICICGKTQSLKNIFRKPLVSGEEELEENQRARSAKLRVAEKV